MTANSDRYTAVAITLHWVMALGVLALAALLRLAWRYAYRPPPLPRHMPQLERLTAHAGHWLLYFFLIALPLTGWALVSASVLNLPTHLYGAIPWPHLPVLSSLPNKAPVEALLKVIHRYGPWTLLVLVAGHAGAALRHHFVQKDDVLLRMLPRLPRDRSTVTALLQETRP